MSEERTRKELNHRYVHQDVYAAEKLGIERICDKKHEIVDLRIDALEKAVKGTDRKITATLVFTIMTLIGLILAITTHVYW